MSTNALLLGVLALAALVFLAVKLSTKPAAATAPVPPPTGIKWKPVTDTVEGYKYAVSAPSSQVPATYTRAQVAADAAPLFSNVTVYMPGDALPSDWPASDITGDSRIRIIGTALLTTTGAMQVFGARIYEGDTPPSPTPPPIPPPVEPVNFRTGTVVVYKGIRISPYAPAPNGDPWFAWYIPTGSTTARTFSGPTEANVVEQAKAAIDAQVV